ncbi:hypothetical protein CHS0354_029087 [Potamilus streckersoni]|uniref:Uncharacterized protein n=1 Tax=Potamilus streckersoni TaxID=2493646 RepID=A0AAE0SWR4_9BIVA|nr:hypothetical protein CHS0354_029087 [Potamilus streckersoni]
MHVTMNCFFVVWFSIIDGADSGDRVPNLRGSKDISLGDKGDSSRGQRRYLLETKEMPLGDKGDISWRQRIYLLKKKEISLGDKCEISWKTKEIYLGDKGHISLIL